MQFAQFNLVLIFVVAVVADDYPNRNNKYQVLDGERRPVGDIKDVRVLADDPTKLSIIINLCRTATGITTTTIDPNGLATTTNPSTVSIPTTTETEPANAIYSAMVGRHEESLGDMDDINEDDEVSSEDLDDDNEDLDDDDSDDEDYEYNDSQGRRMQYGRVAVNRRGLERQRGRLQKISGQRNRKQWNNRFNNRINQ